MSRQHSTKPVIPVIPPDREDLECWRPISGWPGYEVSDLGCVGSYRVIGGYRTGDGSKSRRHSEFELTRKLLKPEVCPSGHCRVTLCRNKGRETKRFLIHVLVLEAFFCSRPAGNHACHYDGNPGNNRLDNLRWDTPAENARDRSRHGRQGASVLSDTDIPPIWGRLVAGEACHLIAKDCGISSAIVSSIKRGVTWSHVTSRLPGWPLAVRPLVPRATAEVLRPVYPSEEYTGREDVWKPIPERIGYQVSNHGRIKRCWYKKFGGLAGRRRGHEFVMGDEWVTVHTYSSSAGYLRFMPWDGTRNVREILVHNAVLSAFACPRPPGLVACHNDGNPSNNHAGNLRWDTQRSNMLEKYRHARERRVAVV